MKIVFVSNYYNHHQEAFSYEMERVTNGNYIFVETEPMSLERKKLGWSVKELPSFVRQSYKTDMDYADCLRMIDEADVVIAGSVPNKILKKRLKDKKITFRYSERPYKCWKNIITMPLRLIKYHTYNYGSKNVYLLCASAFAASDYAKTFNYLGKAFKWGYFPKTIYYSDIDSLICQKASHSILWAGRFIDWKHPEIPVLVAKKIKEQGIKFHLTMIGDGIMLDSIKRMAVKECVDKNITFLGSVSPDIVRNYMEQSEVFLFTSDKNEGWGAVLNESMNSACAVVANENIGSVPYLLHNNNNGLIYTDNNASAVADLVIKLFNDDNWRKTIAKKAYETIANSWNASIAANRFVELACSLKQGRFTPFNDGCLCSLESTKQ